tara:strand:+ start:696 stop:914 length:219 start_codon:yes stop_codon:yes gene_type:complete
MYSLGESVINKNNHKMATVICTDSPIDENVDSSEQTVRIRYEESGLEEWVPVSSVANFLLEVEPGEGNYLAE